MCCTFFFQSNCFHCLITFVFWWKATSSGCLLSSSMSHISGSLWTARLVLRDAEILFRFTGRGKAAYLGTIWLLPSSIQSSLRFPLTLTNLPLMSLNKQDKITGNKVIFFLICFILSCGLSSVIANITHLVPPFLPRKLSSQTLIGFYFEAGTLVVNNSSLR